MTQELYFLLKPICYIVELETQFFEKKKSELKIIILLNMNFNVKYEFQSREREII